jgi:hypothetical protein
VHDGGFLATKHLNGIKTGGYGERKRDAKKNIQRGTKTEKDGNGTVIPAVKKHP